MVPQKYVDLYVRNISLSYKSQSERKVETNLFFNVLYQLLPEGSEENHAYNNQNRRYSGREQKPRPPESEVRALRVASVKKRIVFKSNWINNFLMNALVHSRYVETM
jgi:hypothetical protein